MGILLGISDDVVSVNFSPSEAIETTRLMNVSVNSFDER